MTDATRPDPALESVLESARDLHAVGAITDERLAEYERLCRQPDAAESGQGDARAEGTER